MGNLQLKVSSCNSFKENNDRELSLQLRSIRGTLEEKGGANLWYRCLGDVPYLATDHIVVDVVHIDAEGGCHICAENLPLGEHIPPQSYGP